MSESAQQHREQAAERGPLAVSVITVSDTRTFATDKAGDLIERSLQEQGHRVPDRMIVKDDRAAIRATLQSLLHSRKAQAIIVTGGTGIAKRDVTPDALEGLIDRVIPGFGELFRMLSWEEIGSAAMLSRAIAGVSGETIVFVLPGSRAAVHLALERLILPELHHLVDQARR